MENKEKNPNLEAKELIEPMICSKEDGTPLIEPMVYYNQPLDYNYPLPPMKKIGLEYLINWKKLEEIIEKPIFPDDFIKEFTSSLKAQTVQIAPKIKYATQQTNCEKENPQYSVMKKFLSMVNLIILNETYYVYSGTSYIPTTRKELARLIVKKCRGNIKEQSSHFTDGVIKYIDMEPLVIITEYDISKNYVAFQNCVLDINNRTSLKHSPKYITLYEINANYYSNAAIPTPTFDSYLFSITQGDSNLMERILQIIGYLLTPDKKGKCFFLFQGVPDSGKSILVNLIQKLFSDNAVIQLEAQLFGEKFTASELIGKALCSFPDIPATPLDNATVSRIKLYTGNDPISAAVKFKDNQKFLCSAKFIFTTNHALLTKNEDIAFNNRIVAIPFKYSVPKEKQNFDLEDELLKEKDGIVSKAIVAYFKLVDNGYIFTGNFQPNEVISNSTSNIIDCKIQIYEFVKNRFVSNENGIVFIEDAFICFCQHFNGISKNEFSHYFQLFASKIFNAKQKRKRKSGIGNPISCLTGILFKTEDSYDLSNI